MSFLPISEENQQAPVGQTTNQPGQAGGQPPPMTSGGSVGGGTTGGAGASTGSPTQFGSSASKLGDYLTANAPQVQGQANNVANSLTNQYQGVSGDINNASTTFGQQVQGGYTQANPDLVSQAASNPTGFATTPGNISGFQAQLNDQYTGPQSFESTTPYANIQNEVNTSVQNAGLLGTQQGLENYFGQTQGGNQTQATNALDTLLLQGNQPAYQTVQNAANQFQNLTPQFQQATTGADQNVTAAQQAAQEASQNALNAFTGQNGTLTNLNSQINTGTANDISQAQAQQATLNADLANLYGGVAQNTAPTAIGVYGGGTTPWANMTNYNVGSLSPQDQATLGIDATQAAALQQAMQAAGTSTEHQVGNFGAGSPTSQVDLTQYLQENNPATAYTNANTATPEQYQEMAAIQQLLGSQAPTTGNAIDQSTLAQAGTAPQNMNSFDYANALANAQGLGTAEQQAAQNEAATINAQGDLAHAQGQHAGLWNNIKNQLVPANILGPLNPNVFGPQGPINNINNAEKGALPNGTKPTTFGLKVAHGGIILKDYLEGK